MKQIHSVLMAECTTGGGIAPSIGASNFGHERYVLEVKKIGIICNFAMDGSKNFGLKPNGGYK